jgi:hypothetical protein
VNRSGVSAHALPMNSQGLMPTAELADLRPAKLAERPTRAPIEAIASMGTRGRRAKWREAKAAERPPGA